MHRTLERRGLGPIEIFAYNSTGLIRIEALADQLASFCGAEPVRIVAHSMGGIVTRMAKKRCPDLDLRKVAFLCVPHAGSLMAGLLPFPGVRQLLPDSPTLKELQEDPWEIPTMSVWVPGDLIVIPGGSARFPSSQKEVCCGIPLHNWPVISPFYHHQIADFFLTS